MLSSHLTIWLTAAATALLGYMSVSGGNSEISGATAFSALATAPTAPIAPNYPETNGAQTVIIPKSPDGLFYVTARVNGAPIRFLVDTGANLVVLTSADALKAGVTHRDSTMAAQIDTAGGASAMDRVTLQHMDVADVKASNIDAAIMHSGLKVSLLGQSMLSKLRTITISRDEISIKTDS